jgi:hypothetical protein
VVALEADLGELERMAIGSDPLLLASPPGHGRVKFSVSGRVSRLVQQPLRELLNPRLPLLPIGEQEVPSLNEIGGATWSRT